jgi:uncharacterized FlaG/YvyC family protein
MVKDIFAGPSPTPSFARSSSASSATAHGRPDELSAERRQRPAEAEAVHVRYGYDESTRRVISKVEVGDKVVRQTPTPEELHLTRKLMEVLKLK